MMQTYHREQAIDRINQLSAEGIPFIFIINYKQDYSYIEKTATVNPSELLYNLNGHSNCQRLTLPLTKKVSWKIYPETFAQYNESFETVLKHIQMGDSFLTNLTSKTPITTNLTLQEVFFHSKAKYKLWLKDTFVVFSPETFVRICDGKISSYPMKGTIDASLPLAQQQLMNDPKEAAEHATIVDLIRNDLSIVANQVSVSRYRYVELLQTNTGPILQTSSEISGRLPDDHLPHLGDILFQLLPAGSITGAPKQKTIEIIAQAEGDERGFYTGVAGYFDGKNLDSAVMIRFIEEEGGKMYFKSGGGITSKSNVESEYNEMKQKVYVPIY